MKKRVKIPMRNSGELLDLAKKVREKHLADGEASPLKVLNWDEISPLIDQAVAIEETAVRLKREKLSAYQKRARRLESVLSIVRKSRDILTGVHAEEMKGLGAWGFDVLDNRVSIPVPEEQEEVKAENA